MGLSAALALLSLGACHASGSASAAHAAGQAEAIEGADLGASVPIQRVTRPNIVLLMADDQGWGELGSRGHADLDTPELDAMADAGLTFERFYAAAPVCSPTRASVLTGRHPNRSGVFAWGHHLPTEERTLAEALGEAGYRTAHFGKWHLGSVMGGAPTSPGGQGFDTWLSSPNFYENDPRFSAGDALFESRGESSVVTVAAALDFLRDGTHRTEDSEPRTPSLVVVWFGSPHLPHRATDEDAERLADTPASFRAYRAELEGLDRAVGKLRRGLRDLGIEQDTLVWYTSDNGPRPPKDGGDDPRGAVDRRAQAAGGLRGSKGTLWEGGLRVPSLVEWPGQVPASAVVHGPAGTVDLYPTLLSLAGVPESTSATSVGGDLATATPLHLSDPTVVPLDGVDLSATLLGDAVPGTRPGLGFWSYPSPGRLTYSDKILDGIPSGLDLAPEATEAEQLAADRLREAPTAWPGHAAWVEGRYKLHRRLTAGEGRPGQVVFELYDLVADPAETKDLAGVDPTRLVHMAAELEAWRRDVVADYLAERTAPDAAE